MMKWLCNKACSFPTVSRQFQFSSFHVIAAHVLIKLSFFVCLILFQDLKNLRKQLYAAAEYFELSYTNDDQKRLVVDTIKDYAIKALVNTVDHLGAVSCKLNDMLGQEVDEFSQTELRVSCIRQRLGTSQGCFDHEGLAEQSAITNTPKYHKRYILPVGETMQGGIRTKSKYQGCSLEDKNHSHEFTNGKKIQLFKMFIYDKKCLWFCFVYAAVRATIRETPSSSFRKGRSTSPSTQQPGSFAFAGAVTPKDLGMNAFNIPFADYFVASSDNNELQM
ncbi:protein ABIL2-like [Bidens hawaiensis]|uniref:protein ABIL2-like n=1 Tax=Bidens hawaiensis TaxID=980011 RepID=UPI00404AA3CF